MLNNGHATFTGTPVGYAASGCTKAGYDIGTDLPTEDSMCIESSCRCKPEAYLYMCMDWTMGSIKMTAAEEAFRARTNISVYFGVGTDGCLQTLNSGGCYRLTYSAPTGYSLALKRDLILQAVNSGGDVHCPQFDVQVGVGGQGIHNNCAGNGSRPLTDNLTIFDATQSEMGRQYGGWDNRADCSKSPDKPQHNPNLPDSLVGMCEHSFDIGMRGEGGENPIIEKFSQVTCPQELTQVTSFRRSDQDAWGFDHATIVKTVSSSAEAQTHFNNQERLYYDNSNLAKGCGFTLNPSGNDGSYCLSRMMDCRKPSASWRGNIYSPGKGSGDLSAMCPGLAILPSCRIDGETRVPSTCGDTNCYS